MQHSWRMWKHPHPSAVRGLWRMNDIFRTCGVRQIHLASLMIEPSVSNITRTMNSLSVRWDVKNVKRCLQSLTDNYTIMTVSVCVCVCAHKRQTETERESEMVCARVFPWSYSIWAKIERLISSLPLCRHAGNCFALGLPFIFKKTVNLQ